MALLSTYLHTGTIAVLTEVGYLLVTQPFQVITTYPGRHGTTRVCDFVTLPPSPLWVHLVSFDTVSIMTPEWVETVLLVSPPRHMGLQSAVNRSRLISLRFATEKESWRFHRGLNSGLPGQTPPLIQLRNASSLSTYYYYYSTAMA